MTPPTAPTQRPTDPSRRGAFTLLELMISIALVLVLILGVNAVFSMTAQTVGAGNALGSIYRANLSAHGVIYHDFKSMALDADSPGLIIRCQRMAAFRNPADLEADRNYDGTVSDNVPRDPMIRSVDMDGDGVEQLLAPFIYNHRNHRTDRLVFFARGHFRRQTGSGTHFIDYVTLPTPPPPRTPMNSTEACIWYGHVAVPNNNGFAYSPGAHDQAPPSASATDKNDYNFYATQWVLGRSVMLLLDNPASQNGTAQFLRDNNNYSDPNNPRGSMPLSVNTSAADGRVIQESRYDVAQTSFSTYKRVVRSTFNNNPANPASQWWNDVGGYYVHGDPFVPNPVNPASAAKTNPCFVPACTQFIVEFSGDFITQDAANGNPTAATPDGINDYIQEGTTADPVRRTRWYGMPRDTTGDGRIDPLFDVVPVSVVWGTRRPFERELPGGFTGQLNMNYRDMPAPSQANATTGTNTDNTPRYTVAWGDPSTDHPDTAPRPKMIRITLTIDDPASRLGNGETFEYVGTLK